MSRPRIAIAGFQHETNTFAPLQTGFDIFERSGGWPAMQHGCDVITTMSGLNLPLSGFIDAGNDFDLVPLLWTFAEPSGYVTDDAFDRISQDICQRLQTETGIAGVYFDLHGAMVTQSHFDGEEELLRRVRTVVGPDLPIAVSLDLHANLSPQFFDLISCAAIYRTYPHTDMAATGARAYQLLKQLLARTTPFAKAFRQLNYIIPIQAQSTMRQPGGHLYDMLPSLEGDGVTSIDFAFGFPPADIPHCGPSILAYGTDQHAVNAAIDKMFATLNATEDAFHNPLIPSDQAVQQAIVISATATRPVILADAQDNPGAGATSDTTGILRSLIAQNAQSAVLGMLWDPQTAALAHAAGIGAHFDATIGGRYPAFDPGPLKVKVKVIALSNGRFTFTGPIYGGNYANLGPIAVVQIVDSNCDIKVVIGSNRTQNADQAIFRHIGIDPTKYKIIVVKSAVHFLADYEPIAEQVIFTEAPGANPCQLDRIAFTHLRPGVRLGPKGPVFKP